MTNKNIEQSENHRYEEINCQELPLCFQNHAVCSAMSIPLRMSPSCSSLLSGMPWQMTSLTDVQQDLGKL